MRLKLLVQYDGGPYCGWQVQPEVPSVQGELLRAFHELTGTGVAEMVAAGRTDAGVHALGQVVHVDVAKDMPSIKYLGGLNRFLPPSIRVVRVARVHEDFHARYSATGRHYRYLLWAGRQLRPDLVGRAGHVRHALDVGAMAAALEQLGIGEMDFSGFRDAECQAKTPMCALFYARVGFTDSGIHGFTDSWGGRLVVFEVGADHFLHHMVRNMVGVLVDIGVGKRSISAMREVLDGKDRTKAGVTFAPDGLYMTHVDYPAHAEEDVVG